MTTYQGSSVGQLPITSIEKRINRNGVISIDDGITVMNIQAMFDRIYHKNKQGRIEKRKSNIL